MNMNGKADEQILMHPYYEIWFRWGKRQGRSCKQHGANDGGWVKGIEYIQKQIEKWQEKNLEIREKEKRQLMERAT